jgi:prepilin-type N-terminal cleavage/methylation domain-containing protein
MGGKALVIGAQKESGFSLLEVLVAATLLAIAVIGTGYLLVSGEVSVEDDQWRLAAIREASGRIQWLRTLPTDSPDLEGAESPGKLHLPPVNPCTLDTMGTPLDTSDDLMGYVRWFVTYVDDPRNGTGDRDYRLIRVEVARGADFSEEAGEKVVLETILAR